MNFLAHFNSFFVLKRLIQPFKPSIRIRHASLRTKKSGSTFPHSASQRRYWREDRGIAGGEASVPLHRCKYSPRMRRR
jgi:hypothetical protein